MGRVVPPAAARLVEPLLQKGARAQSAEAVVDVEDGIQRQKELGQHDGPQARVAADVGCRERPVLRGAGAVGGRAPVVGAGGGGGGGVDVGALVEASRGGGGGAGGKGDGGAGQEGDGGGEEGELHFGGWQEGWVWLLLLLMGVMK